MSRRASAERIRKLSRRDPESHFFDPGTMRFFQSRLERGHWVDNATSGWFITSDIHGDGEPRRYTVRSYLVEHDHVSIVTVDDAYQLDTYDQAADAADKLHTPATAE